MHYFPGQEYNGSLSIKELQTMQLNKELIKHSDSRLWTYHDIVILHFSLIKLFKLLLLKLFNCDCYK